MKKILSFLAIAMIMMGLSACSGGAASSPQDAVKNTLNAMKSGDVKALAASCCDRQGNPIDISKEDPAQVKMLESLLKICSDLEYTIGATDDNGDTAQVEVTTKLMGHEQTKKIKCFKGKDGKWRVYLNSLH